MKKKLLIALACLGILSAAPMVSRNVHAAPEETSSTEKKDGWVTVDDVTYYYQNRKKATGFTTIDSKTYFFDTNTGAMKKGFVVYNKRKYFFHPDTGVQVFKWIIYNDKTYYVGSKGYVLKGLQTIKGQRYYFDNKGVMAKSTLVKGKYYAGPSGYFITGWVTIGTDQY